MIAVGNQLGGNEQAPYSCNPNGVILNALEEIFGRVRIGRLWFFHTDLGHHLGIPSDVADQHEDLKVGVLNLEFGRWDGVHAFFFSLCDRVSNISSFVIFRDNLVWLTE